MTSKNSSSAENLSNRSNSFSSRISFREMYRHTLWPAGLSLVCFFLLQVISVVIALTAVRNENVTSGMTAAALLKNLQNHTASLLGPNGAAIWFVPMIAAVFALHAFSWLTDRKAVDFYESQPISRRSNFFDLCRHDFALYLLTYLSTLVLGLLVAFPLGGLSGKVLLLVGKGVIKNVAFYCACYAICVLAAVLTGNTIVAILACGVFFLYEFILRLILSLSMEHWFVTYEEPSTGVEWLQGWTSPLLFLQYGWLKSAGCNLLLGICVLALAYFCYTRRPNEAAGSAVVFQGVRTVVKIAISVLGGLLTGFVTADISGNGIGLFCAVLAAFITAFVMQIIYSKNFQALAKRWPEALISALLSVGILIFFMLDPTGYDTYVPEAKDVKSASISLENNGHPWYDESGKSLNGADAFNERYMFLTDTEAVTALAQELSDRTAALKNGPSEKDQPAGSRITIRYRMQNGKMILRRYSLPKDADAVLMDRITASDEFKEGFFQLYHDEFMERFDPSVDLNFSNEMDSKWITVDYRAFKEAYLQDLRNFCYSYCRQNAFIGTIDLSCRGTDETVMMNYPVYEGFDATIALLEENDIDHVRLNASDLSEIHVVLAADQIDESVLNEENLRRLKAKGVTYADNELSWVISDPSHIAELLETLVPRQYGAPFGGTDYNDRYDVPQIYGIGKSGEYVDLTPRDGEMPEEVREVFAEVFGQVFEEAY